MPTIKEDTSGCNIATVNPFRYRGYYYDAETKFYYLQSRYYDPEVGRFINADDVGVLNSVVNSVDSNLFAYCQNNVINDKDSLGNSIAGKIAQIILSVVAEIYIQLFFDLIRYFVKKYLYGSKEEFSPQPKDYITLAIKTALECINPFSGKKRAKLIYNIVCPAVFVIVDYVWEYAKGKEIDFKKLGYDLLWAMIAGFIDLAMDSKARKEIQKIKKKYRKRNLAFKREKIAIRAQFKVLGKKIKVEFKVAKFITDFFLKYVLKVA